MASPSHRELELKSVVPDPAQLRARLRSAGAMPGYAGLLRDRRYDRDGSLSARDEVLRVREYRHADGSVTAELAWKGPTRRSPEGYKQREEIELAVGEGDSAAGRLGGSAAWRPGDSPAGGLGDPAPDALLRALGYEPVQTIDRWIETYRLEGASVRLEWYPRMDVLVEVEGEPDAIERAIAGTGLERDQFTAEPLVAFAERFRARGAAAVLALAELGGAAPTWEQR